MAGGVILISGGVILISLLFSSGWGVIAQTSDLGLPARAALRRQTLLGLQSELESGQTSLGLWSELESSQTSLGLWHIERR